jgi:GNAT superfamily N-acetyltransferase
METDMGQEWIIRPYKNGDEEAIFELFCAAFSDLHDKDWWLEWWRWKYQHNPAGSPIIWVAEADDRLVAQYAIIPVKMKMGDRIITGSQSVDTMTHPDYRGRGMFLTLSERVFEEAGKQGIEIVYGFPNRMMSWHRKFWLEIDVRSTLIKPLNLRNIPAKKISNTFLLKIGGVGLSFFVKIFTRTGSPPEVSGLTISRISSFDERFNDFWEKVSNDYEIAVVRDMTYLNWRYVEIPNVNYTIFVAEKNGQVMGYSVLRCGQQLGLLFGNVFELVALWGHEPIAQALMLKAIEFFRDEKSDLILYRMIADKKMDRVVRKSGFLSLNFACKSIRFVARSNTPKISKAYLTNRAHWFVQTGDSDAI